MLGFGDNSNNNGSCSATPLDDSMSSMAMMTMMYNPSAAGGTTDHHGHRVSTGITLNKGFNMGQNNNSTTDHHLHHHSSMIKAKIMAHPYFSRLLSAYANCQKVGAPAEVVSRLEEACAAAGSAVVDNSRSGGTGGVGGGGCIIGEDPALDQFMEAYCEMLIKYEQELTKPTKEALLFLSNIDSHLQALTMTNFSACVNFTGRNIGPSTMEEEVDANGNHIDPQAEDKELKNQLLSRYNGYLGGLKQEFLKKKKKGKLPKEAREQLLDWWSRHYKWPYPSEAQKIALVESTGLDQKQINNWFINQRKRHWKPTEDQMQYFVMDASYPHYYLENAFGSPIPMDFTPTNH